MKRVIKLLGVVLILLVLMPMMVVNAKTKTGAFVDILRENVEAIGGEVSYEDDTIEISWTVQNSESNEVSFTYHDNVIEYNSGELTSYEEAESVFSHYIYMYYIMVATLKVNGYTEEQIQDFFTSEVNELSYEVNGIEFKDIGEAQEFTSQDGSMTATVTPMLIRIDVAKANLNHPTDDPVELKDTTIEDIIEALQADESFTRIEDDGELLSENEIEKDDENITIYSTYYSKDYHNVMFSVENDIITYQDEKIGSYDEAESAMSHQMYATQFIMIALEMNGYTREQIQEFFSSEENELSYEVNGIEFKDIGESQEYTSSDGTSTITISPMSIKIDLNKANLDKKEGYKVLEGANQTASLNKDLVFKFNIEYLKFAESGKVYIDGNLVDSKNYVAEEGSTILTIKSDYLQTLSATEHTLKVIVNDGEVETKFTIINNPQTVDNIIVYIMMLVFSMFGLISTGVIYKKESKVIRKKVLPC